MVSNNEVLNFNFISPFNHSVFMLVQHKTNLYWYTWMLTHLKYLLMELRLHNNYLQFYNLFWWKKLDLNPFMCKLFIRNQFKWIAFSTWSSRSIPISKWNYFSNTLDEFLLIERNGYPWRGAPLLWRDRVPHNTFRRRQRGKTNRYYL